VARLLDQHTDPAVGVLASLVERLGELTTLEKQLRFSGLMYRQKYMGVEERLQGSKDAEMHPHPQGQRHQSPDSDDEDSFVASMQHMPGPLSTGALSLPSGSHPPFPILTAADVKALKFHSPPSPSLPPLPRCSSPRPAGAPAPTPPPTHTPQPTSCARSMQWVGAWAWLWAVGAWVGEGRHRGGETAITLYKFSIGSLSGAQFPVVDTNRSKFVNLYSN
jgi:hypothetical protein